MIDLIGRIKELLNKITGFSDKLSDKVVDAVYVDTYYGVAGTAWPIGTPTLPVDNLTDAMTIAAARKTWTIVLASPSDSWTAPADMKWLRIIGTCRDSAISQFDLNGKNFRYTIIENCYLSGDVTTGDSFVAVNCEVDLAITGDAVLYHCRMKDLALYSSNCIMFNCFANEAAAFILYTDAASGFDMLNWSGSIELTNHVAGVFGVIYALGSALINIGAGSTGGTLRVFGHDAKIINKGTGTFALTDYTNRPNDEVPVNIDAIVASETNFLNLAAADTHYTIDDLVLKCVDPGANTVNVRLYQLVNDVLVNTHTFAITNANFGTYFSLMDMFGVPRLAGDNLKITVQASAGGPYAVTGQYRYASA